MHICVFSRAPLTSERELNARARWATEICMRAGRGSGQAMEAQREAGLMATGTRGNIREVLSGGSDLDPPEEREYEESKPITLAEAGIDKHLDESQRAMVAGKIANLAHGVRSDRAANLPLLGESRTPIKQSDTAEMLNVGERCVRNAREVLAEGFPAEPDLSFLG